MASGYDKGFIIEYFDKPKKKITCKDCTYCGSDKSCLIRPFYFPEDGYNQWIDCMKFELRSDAPFHDEKLVQAKKNLKKLAELHASKQKVDSKITHNDENSGTVIKHDKTATEVKRLSPDPRQGSGVSRPSKLIFWIAEEDLIIPSYFEFESTNPIKNAVVRKIMEDKKGFDKPIAVKKKGTKYQLTDGYRRYLIAQSMGFERFPVILAEKKEFKKRDFWNNGQRVFSKKKGYGVITKTTLEFFWIRWDSDKKVIIYHIDDLESELGLMKANQNKQ